MPIKSKAQLGAMYAAAEGKSTIGIPKKVGKEFVKAGKQNQTCHKKYKSEPLAAGDNLWHILAHTTKLKSTLTS